MKILTYSTMLLAMLVSVGCIGKNGTAQTDRRNEPKIRRAVIELPELPKVLSTDAERARYILEHYWQSLSWNDTTLIGSKELANAFYQWANILSSVAEETGSSVSQLIVTQGTGHQAMQSALMGMVLEYFEDPNSPYRNEELLIPILKAYSHDESIPQIMKTRPQYLLEQYDRNRKGTTATDITIAGKDNRIVTLKDIIRNAGTGAPANHYVLLYFFNPDCHDCERVSGILSNDPTVKQLRKEKVLHIAAIYPDRDLESWNAHIADQYPSDWTVGRLASETEYEKYYLPAIPNLYLLGSDGRIILKDAAIETIVKYLLEDDICDLPL